MHVRKGDQVVVIAGKDKGKRGKVLRLVTDKGRVVIERVNMVKRHTKPTQRNPQGGIVEKEGSVHISNVALLVRQVRRARARQGRRGRRRSEEAPRRREVRHRVRERLRGIGNGDKTTKTRRRPPAKPVGPRCRPSRKRRWPPRRRRARRPRPRAAKAARARLPPRPRKSPWSASSATSRRACARSTTAKSGPKLMKEFAYKNRMQVPRLTQDHDQHGPRRGGHEPEDARQRRRGAERDHRPDARSSPRAKKSIAIFKLREGQKIGAMVTLRRERMWEFLDRLVNFALPRVRDFKGVSPKSFDGRGNYTIGVREADHLPGDRLRQDRQDQGHEHHHRHDGAQRRTGPRAARRTSECRSGS